MLKHFFIYYKICFVRTAGYIQMIMLTVIMFKQWGIPMKWLPLGFVAISVFVLAIGTLDKIFIHSEELRTYFERNPVIQEILREVKKK